MKKLILPLASLCLIFSISSCRETEKKADEITTEIEEIVIEAEKEVEKIVDTTKNAIEESVDGIKDAANEAVDGAKEVVDETTKKMGDAVKDVIETNSYIIFFKASPCEAFLLFNIFIFCLIIHFIASKY